MKICTNPVCITLVIFLRSNTQGPHGDHLQTTVKRNPPPAGSLFHTEGAALEDNSGEWTITWRGKSTELIGNGIDGVVMGTVGGAEERKVEVITTTTSTSLYLNCCRDKYVNRGRTFWNRDVDDEECSQLTGKLVNCWKLRKRLKPFHPVNWDVNTCYCSEYACWAFLHHQRPPEQHRPTGLLFSYTEKHNLHMVRLSLKSQTQMVKKHAVCKAKHSPRKQSFH